MATDGSKQRRAPAVEPPPRTLDVRKYAESRAAELESLHSIISKRLNDDFRSSRHKRRRTTGFQNHKKRRRKTYKEGRENDDDEKNKKLPRRVRRRIELKKNLETGFSVSGDGTKRLRTHVWHAKRFTMTKLWGFYLPLGLHGSGRGSRALLKRYKQGAVVHDASYYSVVQLQGPEESLLSILSSVLVPFPNDHSEEISKSILAGETYGGAMLHPAGQDNSKAVSPVTYLWQPLQQHDNGDVIEDNGTDGSVKPESSTHFRRLWIWMHPSTFGKGFDHLRLACTKKMEETGVLVHCVSLDEQLARLEIMGLRAFQLLQKILHPLSSSLEGSWKLKSCSTTKFEKGCDIQQKRILEKIDCLASRGAVSLAVVDPRILPDKRSGSVPETQLASSQCDLPQDNNGENPAEDIHMKEASPSTLQSMNESDSSVSNSKDLWDASQGVCPPTEENVLCLERHNRSLDFFCIKKLTSENISSDEHPSSRLCPIMLMRNSEQAGLLSGWSIILPISWVKTFWIALVSGGAHPIGLREKHWIACDVGLPCFPSDFPDCDAYSCLMAREAAEVDLSIKCRPPAVRPFKVPLPPPWNKISFALDKVGGHMTEVKLTDLNSKINGGPPINSVACEIFVARTSRMLTSFLKERNGEHLLLFPKEISRRSFSYLVKDEAKISQASDVTMFAGSGRGLCYLRVLLRAYKEGVFDEGAVVCAPRFSDLSLWTCRSESDEFGLQVPNAFVSSYFKELSSDEWEFHLPEDCAAREAYRQPIGFVTTGFVRGSKRPTAVGFCGATLLACLRHEQWSRMPAKRRRKEIFVLVRNLRSSAYRLALATIVLEEQEEDVQSL